jgi:GNAT superfamily N-acetyltransferase
MPTPAVRPVARADRAGWEPLWAGYNAFYGREGETALPVEVTEVLWERFFDPAQPIHALVAEEGGRLVGLVHYIFHANTTRPEGICYLQDLFTAQSDRGRGIGRALILAVYEAAKANGVKRVYWHTQETNAAGRLLYDKVGKHYGFIVYAHDG